MFVVVSKSPAWNPFEPFPHPCSSTTSCLTLNVKAVQRIGATGERCLQSLSSGGCGLVSRGSTGSCNPFVLPVAQTNIFTYTKTTFTMQTGLSLSRYGAFHRRRMETAGTSKCCRPERKKKEAQLGKILQTRPSRRLKCCEKLCRNQMKEELTWSQRRNRQNMLQLTAFYLWLKRSSISWSKQTIQPGAPHNWRFPC